MPIIIMLKVSAATTLATPAYSRQEVCFAMASTSQPALVTTPTQNPNATK